MLALFLDHTPIFVAGEIYPIFVAGEIYSSRAKSRSAYRLRCSPSHSSTRYPREAISNCAQPVVFVSRSVARRSGRFAP
jgi:hypothetical protein